MRSLRMIVSSVAVVVAIGGAVYYFFPKQPVDRALPDVAVPQIDADSRVLVLPDGNPLLTADKSQFRQWFPAYCGADMFVQAAPSPHKMDVCVNGIVKRVKAATGVELTRADVLDPRVKAHWREVMEAK